MPAMSTLRQEELGTIGSRGLCLATDGEDPRNVGVVPGPLEGTPQTRGCRNRALVEPPPCRPAPSNALAQVHT
jgi:hypothetical protein